MKKFLAIAALMLISSSFVACSTETTDPSDGTKDTETTESTESTEAEQGEQVTIVTPAAGDTVSSPFSVTGTTDSPNTDIRLVSYGVDGAMNNESEWKTDSEGNFEFNNTYYFIGGGGEGRIEVILMDESGAEVDKAVIPVVFE